MKVKCVVCHAVVASMTVREAMLYIAWLEREGTVPVCFECSERAVANLYLQLYPLMKVLIEPFSTEPGDVF